MFRVVITGLRILRLFDIFNQGVVMLSKLFREVFCCGNIYRRLGHIAIETDTEFWMIAIIGIERRTLYCGLIGIVVCELCKG